MNLGLGWSACRNRLCSRLESRSPPNEVLRTWPRAPTAKASCVCRSSRARSLYPATSDSEKISFNQLNKATGHRIKYLKVDADTGEEVPNEDIVKGYMLEELVHRGLQGGARGDRP
jgi:hypothetical protein